MVVTQALKTARLKAKACGKKSENSQCRSIHCMEAVVVVWKYHFVMLSYILSIFGSWTTLLLMEQARIIHGREDIVAFVGSLLSLGICAIWSMHFMGMLSLDLGILVHYDIVWVSASAIIAAIFCRVGIWGTKLAWRNGADSVSFAETWKHLLALGVWTGVGTALMHYMGMKSVVVHGLIMHLNPFMFFFSVVLAIVAATTAFCVFHYPCSTALQPCAAVVTVRDLNCCP